jgi:glycosyltransferase involved in cell wall biosynthesis
MSSCNTGNVLLVSNYPSDTGYAWWLMERLWATFAALAAEGGNRTYLAYPALNGVSDVVSAAAIEPVEMTIPWQTPQQREQVLQFIRERRIETVYFTDQPYFSSLYPLMRRAGVKRIIVHDHTPGDRPKAVGPRAIFKRLRNSVAAYTADLFINVSPAMRSRSIESGCVPESKCVTVQNGIDPVACEPGLRAGVREGLGIATDSVMIVTSGRAHPYKRFDFIVRVAAEMRTLADRDYVFALLGDGDMIPQLKTQIDALGVQDKVRLLGFRRDVRQILCAADVAIHAALGEGFSLSIIEYMSSGLPVVVPDIPSVCQAIEPEVTGLVYAHNSVQQAAASVASLCSDSARRTQMGKRAKERADSAYTSGRTITEFTQALRDLYSPTDHRARA